MAKPVTTCTIHRVVSPCRMARMWVQNARYCRQLAGNLRSANPACNAITVSTPATKRDTSTGNDRPNKK